VRPSSCNALQWPPLLVSHELLQTVFSKNRRTQHRDVLPVCTVSQYSPAVVRTLGDVSFTAPAVNVVQPNRSCTGAVTPIKKYSGAGSAVDTVHTRY